MTIDFPIFRLVSCILGSSTTFVLILIFCHWLSTCDSPNADVRTVLLDFKKEISSIFLPRKIAQYNRILEKYESNIVGQVKEICAYLVCHSCDFQADVIEGPDYLSCLSARAIFGNAQNTHSHL